MDFRNMSDEAKMYIKAIIECIDDGIWITDGSGTCLEINRQALGCQKREDIRKDHERIGWGGGI